MKLSKLNTLVALLCFASQVLVARPPTIEEVFGREKIEKYVWSDALAFHAFEALVQKAGETFDGAHGVSFLIISKSPQRISYVAQDVTVETAVKGLCGATGWTFIYTKYVCVVGSAVDLQNFKRIYTPAEFGGDVIVFPRVDIKNLKGAEVAALLSLKANGARRESRVKVEFLGNTDKEISAITYGVPLDELLSLLASGMGEKVEKTFRITTMRDR